jgi:hypothetical protein
VTRLLKLVLAAWLLASCRCDRTSLVEVPPARWVTSPERLTVPATYVGQRGHATLEVSNLGVLAGSAELSIEGPFELSVHQLELAAGESVALEVSFSPTTVGLFSTTLRVGPLEVPVDAEGIAVPVCEAASACEQSQFEYADGQCIVKRKPNGAACQTQCIESGACSTGVCVGRFKACDDRNACTVDACNEDEGCSHAPRVCPSSTNRCQVAQCDLMQGCGFGDVADGTPCGANGPDDCLSTQVEVCVAGQCVQRTRPEESRCAGRWVPSFIPMRTWKSAMAYDSRREKLVVFDGSGLGDTWEWDGTTWLRRTPATAPPARTGHAMVYDPARQRILLFGGMLLGGARGGLATDDTWEWDGTTWLQRAPLSRPPSRAFHGMAYDAARQRVVLFGGTTISPPPPLSDTWEWDGATWLQRAPATSPPARSSFAMTYDAARQRVILFGGGGMNDTWEWDGMTWHQRTPATSPSRRIRMAMTYDVSRRRVVLFGGMNWTGSALSDTWEWDGTNWQQRSTMTSPSARHDHAIAYDTARDRVVVFSGSDGFPTVNTSDVWELNGAIWQPQSLISPSIRAGHSMTYETHRQRVLLFGGAAIRSHFSDTWEWDGTAWLERTPATSPPPRMHAMMAYDTARQRAVLFGGFVNGSNLSDTWEWDGTTWLQRTPATSPSALSSGAMVYDVARQRVVLFGGGTLLGGGITPVSETWEWDGTTWSQRRAAASPSPRLSPVMAYDSTRGRVVLFGGHSSGVQLSDTWEWDGTSWLQRTPATSPPQSPGGLAYDEARQRIVFFGGAYPTNTWEWDGATWTEKRPLDSPVYADQSAMVYDGARRRLLLFTGTDTWMLMP